jgi:hypothetical protein
MGCRHFYRLIIVANLVIVLYALKLSSAMFKRLFRN